MFRALSLLAVVSVALATPNIPRTLLLSRQIAGSSGSSCSDVCLDVSDILQSCTTATTCCPSSVISEVVECVNCGVANDVETEADGQGILDDYTSACAQVGVDTGPLTVDAGSASGSATATPTISASSASAAGASATRSASAVFTPVTALSSLEASASAIETSVSASAARSASAASSSSTSDSGSGVNIPGTAGSGATGLSAPAAFVLTAAVGVAAVFLA
ncbi:hypothetical protein PENSPDRAFT_664380 [Peniophora sp. CONT]|nr:hypothetical protein PENSPDRAFT_664380 [Peniophora sp. CONT]